MKVIINKHTHIPNKEDRALNCIPGLQVQQQLQTDEEALRVDHQGHLQPMEQEILRIQTPVQPGQVLLQVLPAQPEPGHLQLQVLTEGLQPEPAEQTAVRLQPGVQEVKPAPVYPRAEATIPERLVIPKSLHHQIPGLQVREDHLFREADSQAVRQEVVLQM